jgi:glycosyltransferase involved in cell wall biosynthesis
MKGAAGTMRNGKIGILVPAFNGGALLRETVMSAAGAGLPPDCYEILVSDNASTDGSVAALPERDAQGAPVTVRHNDVNIGRVANWNRALVAAEEMGFSYAIFLMVGDRLTDGSLLALRDRMARQEALLGIAPYQIVDEALRPLRIARRIYWQGDADAGLRAERFLAQSLATGAMLYAPLGANLYRIDGRARLRFDPGDETHTDHLATALFAQHGRIVYLDRPVSMWRQRTGRFHSSMTVAQRLAGDLRVMECACRAARLDPDYSKIRASMLLRGAIFHRGNVRRAWRHAHDIPQEARISWTWLLRLLVRQMQHRTPWLVEA